MIAASLSKTLARLLLDQQLTLATAESCTGGLIASTLTDLPGSSEYFLGGVVSYSNALKMALLGVPEALLLENGAVSEPVAVAMAVGARKRLGTDIAVSVTGIAGPGGGSLQKPVGLTFIGTSGPWGEDANRFVWQGDRLENKRLSVRKSLELLVERLEGL